MTCAVCGAALTPGAMFCGGCGSAVAARPAGPGAIAVASVVPAPVPLAAPAPAAHPAPAPPPAARAHPAATAGRTATPDEDPASAAAPPAAPAPPSATPDEHTRLPVARATAPASRFVLQFSTGESVTVSGTGLVGRRPEAQPGEFFDVLVAIDDPGRSVSKTHLEFGQDGGTFWVADRFSANGTVVREPERAARLSAPGMRSRVARGSRVEIGEQFFVVS